MVRRLIVAGFVAACAVCGSFALRNRERRTSEETKAIDAARNASIRAGWWGDGYEVKGVGRIQEQGRWTGWAVSFSHPGGYSGGHHSVLLDKGYHLVRLIGGK